MLSYSSEQILLTGSKIIFRIYGLVCAVVLVLFTLVNFYNMKEGGFKTDLGEDVDPRNVSYFINLFKPTR